MMPDAFGYLEYMSCLKTSNSDTFHNMSVYTDSLVVYIKKLQGL